MSRKEAVNCKVAQQKDFCQIHELLISSGLSTAGVDFGKGNYYIAGAQEIIGVVGAEQYGRSVMLRSLAVKPQFRKAGVAQQLIDYAFQELKGTGVTDVYLITTTAEEYLRRHGFSKIERDKVPQYVLAASALGNACPSSSTCMHMTLFPSK